MVEEVSQLKLTMIPVKRRKDECCHDEGMVNFLLTTQWNGFIYSNGSEAYLIPIQRVLGHKFSPLKSN